ncbi:MAG: hypothetical protein IIB16_08165, partial [Chloroflexi bacterium]|nr:hypothetical protein [Chloroflexota bacterium]
MWIGKSMLKRKLLVAAIVGAGAGLSVSPALAHAFGDRYDLPIPLNFFLVGAAATVALSFVVIGVFVRRGSETIGYPRYNLLGAGLPGAFLGSRVFIGMIRLIAVAIFALVLATSLFGTGKPLGNLSPTFVWIIWWVGIGYVSALAGNLWRLVNPWKIVFEWAEALTGRGGRPGESSGLFRYPEGWGVWPAVVLFLIFAWLENVYPGAVIPGQLGLLIILYSLATWAGMVVFGKQTWLKHGEAFSVLFGFFARFSPTEVRVSDSRQCRTCELGCNPTGDDCVDCYACFERAEPGQRQFNLRPFAVGLAQAETVSTSTAFFVVLALATVTFDGLQETPTWGRLQTAAITSMPFLGRNAIETIDSLGVVLMPAIFLGVYLMFASGIRLLSRDDDTGVGVARAFVFSLVPIALAYNMAHFISLLLIQGQLIIPLASDPFGFGWDLLGTADYRVNIGVIKAKVDWFIADGAIVLGHIIFVYVAHV